MRLTPKQRNCIAWFRDHEPGQAMTGLKTRSTFDMRTVASLVRRGILTFTPSRDEKPEWSPYQRFLDGVVRLTESGQDVCGALGEEEQR